MTFYSNVKQKSYVLNPRGKPLYEDSNRFGTKMLEKMGWSKGKGLGINLDGEQNFIKVSHKADQKGIGFEDRDDQWVQHESEFNSLLKSLDNSATPSDNDDDVDEGDVLTCRGFGFGTEEKASKKKKKESITAALSGKSLEEMSKKSRSRVHYKKFTRGKDLSKYSEKDLANIFGKKATNDDDDDALMVEESKCKKNVELPLSNYGITTIETGTTISDYFHKKKEKLLGHSRNSSSIEGENSVDEPAPKRKKTKKEKLLVVQIGEEPSKEEKKKKKRKKSLSEAQIIIADDAIVSAEPIKKKKKKSKYDDGLENRRENRILVEDNEIIEIDSEDSLDAQTKKLTKKKKRSQTHTNDISAEVMANESKTKSNTNFIANILSTLMNINNPDCSSTEVTEHNTGINHIESSSNETSSRIAPIEQQIAMETYEINRYQAEMFRFVDLDGFQNANLSDLTGYGYSKNIDLKVTAKIQDRHKINDLWDYALINKYGKDVIKTKKKQKYSIKTLKKKNLFKVL